MPTSPEASLEPQTEPPVDPQIDSNSSSHQWSADKTECPSSAYMGDGSLLSWPQVSHNSQRETVHVLSAHVGAILQATGADQMPAAPLFQSSIDFYFQHLYTTLPIIERKDLDSSSILIRQATHFAGCLVRRAEGSTSTTLHEAYDKIRTLLFLGVESNSLFVLKTLCLMSCWSPNAPDMVTLDSAWHWSGSAMRLAVQMGLHRESTHQRASVGQGSRRLWWCAFVSN